MGDINQLALRDAYNVVDNVYEQEKVKRSMEGKKYVKPIITPSDLRLELNISASVTVYEFPVLTTDQGVGTTNGTFNTELRLNINDSFWAVLAGLYIAAPSSATSAEFKLYSYPNTTAFTAAKAALYDVFFNNSKLEMNINNVQYIQSFSTARFRRAPYTQEGLGATSSTAAPANVPSTTLDAFDGNNDGLTALGTIIELPGQRKNILRIIIPAALSAAATANNRIILMYRGYLALNAATR